MNMDVFIYSIIAVLAGFVIWMIFQFMKEWPSYKHQ